MRHAPLVLALSLVPAVAFGGFRVSSFKKETRLGENTYNAASALDSDPKTCWQVNPENENVGSWFEVDLPKSSIDSLGVMIGWEESEEQFQDYARLKTLKLELFDEAQEDKLVLEHSLTFADERGWQTLDVPGAAFGNEIFGGRLRLTVVEIYPGKDYPNLALSELLVRLAEYDAPAILREQPSSSAEGHDGDLLLDDDPRTFWLSGEMAPGATFTVEADGFGVSSVGITQGPRSHARPKTIAIEANNQTRTYTLEDKAGMQWFEVPAITGYTGSGWGVVKITVVDTHEGPKPNVGIAEVKLKATNYGGL